MNIFCIFQMICVWWSSIRIRYSIFHTFVLPCVIISWALVLCYDVNTPVKEDYLIKSHKVIEALPRVLQRTQKVPISPALVAYDSTCSADPTGTCNEKQALEAISLLHRQLDDDASGDIDVSESDEFLRDELNYENGYERHKEFHGNDKAISVEELWQSWRVSEVHNWTVDETVDWLITAVELPQYEHNFRNNGVDGSCLPRLAINSNSYMSVELKIKDPIHRQKISLKAMDIVLFGGPKRHNYLKDALLGLSLLIAIGGVWFAYVQHKYSQNHMQKMMKDMEILQKAEEALSDLQQELNKARQEQEIVNIEKQDLERRLHDEMSMSKQLLTQDVTFDGTDQCRVMELERQLQSAKTNLHEAEKRLEAKAWVAPVDLQHWLQLTHEFELRNYNAKKAIAELQLQAAKDGCDKLRRKRSTFMGAFRIAHGSSIDDVDDRIIQAKAALSELTSDLQERMNRWKHIEVICGFPIVHNKGIGYLQSILKSSSANGLSPLTHSSSSSSEGTVHEESPPPYPVANSAGAIVTFPPPSVPPPSYSACSPTFSRKTASVSPPDKHHLNTSAKPVSNTKMNSNVHNSENIGQSECSQILEITDEDECDEDDCTERSETPPSCSSNIGHSDVNKTNFSIGDNFSDQNFIVKTESSQLVKSGNIQKSQDEVSVCSDELVNVSSSSIKAGEPVRKISTSVLEKKKKLGHAFVNALRISVSSSNLVEHDNVSESASQSSDGKQKKKKFFPQLLRRKTKML